ncbi:DUF732 domain-containing protein [Mycobacterium sp.]|uniref:DUF732 domain-containing protein n=1 Tax=Mycobacterium sp. TaxID=1785 RepID=UPI00126AA224|nr:DUF732 domain-containing protein [Mycobacterium sp.]KAA8969547.1 MAG: DUF732 domain-containing protein [Mycobacterium sp.]
MRSRQVLAVTVAAIALAAPAHADDQAVLDQAIPGQAVPDQAFLADLDHAGIRYQDSGQAVTAGQTVCSLKASGVTDDDLVSHLTDQNPGFAQEKAAKFTKIATTNYCPGG